MSIGTDEQFDLNLAKNTREQLFKTLLYSNQRNKQQQYIDSIWDIFGEIMTDQIKHDKTELQDYCINEL